jgi:hypothetical protein
MEYLGAPADVGAGEVRAAQGHPKPWTETFKRIHLEFGNEPWNWVTPYIGNGFTGPDYWKSIIGAAKDSPYYRPTVVFHVAGRSIGKGGDPVENTPNADRATWAPYIVHDLSKEQADALDTDERFFRWALAQGVHYAREKHERQVATAHKLGKPVSLYEINHHVHHGTASTEAKRKINATMGGGLDVINSMLIWLKENQAKEQAFYGARFDWYESLGIWGGAITYRDGQARYRPNWLAIVAANKVLSGDLVETIQTGHCPMFVPLNYDGRSKKVKEAEEPLPEIWSYAFADGNHRGLILLNLAITQRREVMLKLAGRPTGAATCWEVTAEKITAMNEPDVGEPQVHLTERTLEHFADGQTMTLRPFSMTVLKWTVN